MGRPQIVVLGMMTKIPVAGVVWQTLHYLVGFERLGYETYYVEAHARTPSMLMEHPEDDGSGRAAAFIAGALERFGFGGRWAYQALHQDGRCYGLSERRLNGLYQNAALIINLHGGTEPRTEHVATDRLVYLETDPVEVEVQLAAGRQDTIDFLKPHCAYFTFAQNYGRPDCLLPLSAQFRLQPTRQPVVLDFWQARTDRPNELYTTIGNWRQQWRGRRHTAGARIMNFSNSWGFRLQLGRALNLPWLAAAKAIGSCWKAGAGAYGRHFRFHKISTSTATTSQAPMVNSQLPRSKTSGFELVGSVIGAPLISPRGALLSHRTQASGMTFRLERDCLHSRVLRTYSRRSN